MERKIEYMIKEIDDAIKNFADSLNIDITKLDEKVADSVKSGQIQKFEFSVELLWKMIKAFLFENDGIETFSPKQTIKEFFNTGYIDYEEYEVLINMIDDRNFLSHIYKKEMFENIIRKTSQIFKSNE